MTIRAVDLPSLRDEAAEWTLRIGPALYERAILEGRQTVAPLASPTRAGNHLAAEEVTRLKNAELFFVSSDMTELARAAAATLPDFTLMPEDLPAPCGLIVFEQPLFSFADEFYKDMSGPLHIIAMAWSHWDGGRLPDGTPWPFGAMWATWYTDRNLMVSALVTASEERRKQVESTNHLLPRLVLDNESQIPFSPTGITVSEDGQAVPFSESSAIGMHRWMAVIKTTWLLMTQPVTTVTEATFDRAAKRRAERLGAEPPRVRVITLRRAAHAGNGTSDREYHHQWIVRGHWRQQWYAARQVHRPIWIAPHVKGPEDAPMLGGEKVYAWTR